MPAAKAFRPAAGTCHADLKSTGNADSYAPIPCSGPHLAETAAVADATTDAQAFAECSKRATAFLGGDWRTGWVVMQPVRPTRAATKAGVRWVRCDVVETDPVDGALVRHAGTLKGTLKTGGRLRMTCANPKVEGERVSEMHPVACGSAHTAEFAGLFATARADSSDITEDELGKGCNAAIARFTGLRNDGDLPSRVGWLGFPPDDAAWEMGDRAIRCFLWLDGERMKGSYRNAGPGKLKIHYSN